MNTYILPMKPLEVIADYELWRSKYKISHGKEADQDAEASYLQRYLNDPHTMVLMATYASVRRQKVQEQTASAN